MNQNTAINSSVETVTNGLEQKVAVNLGFAKPSASIARSFSVINGSAAIAGIDKGNLFAPLPGNRHRITGLIQRKSVV